MKRKRIGEGEAEAPTAGTEKVRFTTHSKSLYNITQSPGWSDEENKVLKLGIMKFGVGAWTKIMSLGICPGKTNAQFNLQVQRMLGQQSLAGFAMLKVNVDDVRKDNEIRVKEMDKKEDKEQIYIKSGLIINAGENPTRESKQKILEENRKKYELSQEEIDQRVSEIDLFKCKRSKRLEFEELLKKYSMFDAIAKENEELDRDKEIKILQKEIEIAQKELEGMTKRYRENFNNKKK
jgi:hypothetical protein